MMMLTDELVILILIYVKQSERRLWNEKIYTKLIVKKRKINQIWMSTKKIISILDVSIRKLTYI